MSLQRHDLHDELVALIAAGRELPPEHDGILADTFLHHARFQSPPLPARTGFMDWLRDGRVLAAALALALSAFLFGTMFAHAGPAYGPRPMMFQVRGDDDGHVWHFQGQLPGNWPPDQQQAPAAPNENGPGA